METKQILKERRAPGKQGAMETSFTLLQTKDLPYNADLKKYIIFTSCFVENIMHPSIFTLAAKQ